MTNHQQLAVATLQKFFGFADFRPGQLEIVSAILEHQDVLAILPTGGGKSLCFQVPALIFPGTILVISPLISLMKDQVDHLEKLNIAASYLSSTLPEQTIQVRLSALRQGKYKIFYLAPERLLQPQVIAICQQIHIPLLVIDEAHCISLWGCQFRPSYQKIPEFIEKIQKKGQKIIVAAFTATATNLVIQEIKKFLALQQIQIFQGGFIRTNIIFQNLICDSMWIKNLYLFKLLKMHRQDNIIIYCSTRVECERLAKLIKYYDFHHHYQLDFYHGGLEKQKRERVQNAFLTGQIKIMIATNAFGMGVDKSDIRVVIHYQISAHLENYYQEAGRAGRDRQLSYAYLLYYDKDLLIQQQMIERNYEDQDHPRKQIELQKLATMQEYALSQTCLQKRISDYFSQSQAATHCQNCYHCLHKELTLDLQEQRFVKGLEELNRLYEQNCDYQALPVLLTVRQMELMAILEIKNLTDLQKIPGVGSGIISFYANQRFSSEISRNC